MKVANVSASPLYAKVEELIKTNEGMSSLLQKLHPTFLRLEEIISDLKENPKVNGDEIALILKESTGIWEYLHCVHTTVDTYKSNKELLYFEQKRMATEEKVNVSALEKEARVNSSEERRVRNIVEAYANMADKSILTCQSLLKNLIDSNKRVSQPE